MDPTTFITSRHSSHYLPVPVPAMATLTPWQSDVIPGQKPTAFDQNYQRITLTFAATSDGEQHVGYITTGDRPSDRHFRCVQ